MTKYAFNERRSFIREIYDGELSVKLKKGLELPAMDPWVCYVSTLFAFNITVINLYDSVL